MNHCKDKHKEESSIKNVRVAFSGNIDDDKGPGPDLQGLESQGGCSATTTSDGKTYSCINGISCLLEQVTLPDILRGTRTGVDGPQSQLRSWMGFRGAWTMPRHLKQPFV